jgi:phosphatidylglycerophosphatase A
VKGLAYHTATVLGLGDKLPAAGTTAGSLPAALVWAVLAYPLGSSPWFVTVGAALVTAATIAGIWAADAEIVRRKKGDPGPVVIDEVAGQWLTYLCAQVLWPLDDVAHIVVFVAFGFLLFRVFDVVKPWPVRPLERLPGGFGVVADDLAAGVLAGIVLALSLPWMGWAVELAAGLL